MVALHIFKSELEYSPHEVWDNIMVIFRELIMEFSWCLIERNQVRCLSNKTSYFNFNTVLFAIIVLY